MLTFKELMENDIHIGHALGIGGIVLPISYLVNTKIYRKSMNLSVLNSIYWAGSIGLSSYVVMKRLEDLGLH